MALDFPASPSVNQTYSGPGGVVWVWDGAKWVSGTGSTVYAPVTSPVFLGNPTAPNPPAGDADTSVATTSFVAAAVGTALHDIGRNFIHNPLMAIAQRGTGPFTGSVYTLDRWCMAVISDTASVTQQNLADLYRTQIGDEAAKFAFANTFTGSAAAGAYNFVYQNMEDLRRFTGKTVTVSFWATSGTALKLGVNFYISYGTGGSPTTGTWLTAQSVTTTGTFTRYSLTFAIPSSVGTTFGSNNDSFCRPSFWYSSGASLNVTAGNIGVQSGTTWLWGVQLEIGSVATPLEKPDPRYDLANCMRFYQFMSFDWEGYQTAGQYASYNPILPQWMRAVPTVTPSNLTITNAGPVGITAQDAGTVHIYAAATATGSFVYRGNFIAAADL